MVAFLFGDTTRIGIISQLDPECVLRTAALCIYMYIYDRLAHEEEMI